MTDDELAAVLARARERVDPTPDERARLEAATERLLARTEAAVADLPVEADAVLVGSTARGTWIAGDRDVDLFVRFPPALGRAELEAHGLAVGHRVLPGGREEYAEHPYVTGAFEGFDVDCVPCFRVENAAESRSAVDRTPFHTRYLETRLDDALAADVRLLKGFLAAIGVYGSDLRTRGFSGYLAELLVLEHGGFRALVGAAADWSPPVRLDPQDHATRAFDDPLVVIDPTDPERNVAAVLSPTNLARFQHYARELLADPRIALFERDTPGPLSPTAVRTEIERRGTTPIAVRFGAPELVDDQLYPQLEKSLAGVRRALDAAGFDVLRAAAFAAGTDDAADASGATDGTDASTDGANVTATTGGADGETGVDAARSGDADGDGRGIAVLLCECAVAERPPIERHEGPPLGAREHAAGFHEKYADADCYGPFVEGDRYVVEREREYRKPRAVLESALFDVGLGTNVEPALREGHELLVGRDCAALARTFGVELARYFDPEP
ncbi:CCA tRNA nucleotidyltransferase [Halobacteriales archaeon QS_4_69_34]|nr:MAG: CCA tRNA nucleotidyltransferase [Halobacteriales archaeon QS_4_69_34]